MMALSDITPQHNPVRMLRDVANQAIERRYIAAVVIALREDDELDVEMCAIQKKDILWAMEKYKHKLFDD